MDNLAHTLAGAALAKAGLDRRTPLAMPTLLIAANLPDIDVLAYLRDPLFALTFRRGWTHGVLAMAILPVALAGAMAAWDRMVRLRWRPHATPAVPRELVLVSLVGVLSHPLLDLLNTYGVRLLMPFSGKWFFGDTLFIVDPWLWAMLAAGTGVSIWQSRRAAAPASSSRPAWTGVTAALVYASGMFVLGRAAAASSALDAAELGWQPADIMASPVPVDALRRSVLFDLGDGYRWGSFDWRRSRPRLVPDPAVTPRSFDDPAVAAALQHPDARAFLSWSRFPAAAVTPEGVRLYDLRYADAETDSWASVLIPAR